MITCSHPALNIVGIFARLYFFTKEKQIPVNPLNSLHLLCNELFSLFCIPDSGSGLLPGIS